MKVFFFQNKTRFLSSLLSQLNEEMRILIETQHGLNSEHLHNSTTSISTLTEQLHEDLHSALNTHFSHVEDKIKWYIMNSTLEHLTVSTNIGSLYKCM